MEWPSCPPGRKRVRLTDGTDNAVAFSQGADKCQAKSVTFTVPRLFDMPEDMNVHVFAQVQIDNWWTLVTLSRSFAARMYRDAGLLIHNVLIPAALQERSLTLSQRLATEAPLQNRIRYLHD